MPNRILYFSLFFRDLLGHARRIIFGKEKATSEVVWGNSERGRGHEKEESREVIIFN
jgi:hypothetical protein